MNVAHRIQLISANDLTEALVSKNGESELLMEALLRCEDEIGKCIILAALWYLSGLPTYYTLRYVSRSSVPETGVDPSDVIPFRSIR